MSFLLSIIELNKIQISLYFNNKLGKYIRSSRKKNELRSLLANISKHTLINAKHLNSQATEMYAGEPRGPLWKSRKKEYAERGEIIYKYMGEMT